MTQNTGKYVQIIFYDDILMFSRIIRLSPFRAFLGVVIILVSLGYIGYREIQIAKRLAPKNAIIRDAVHLIHQFD